MKFLKKVLKPKSTTEDNQRKEFILNVLLSGTIFLLFTSFLIRVIQVWHLENYKGMPPSFVFIALIFFIFLLFLSKIGFFKVSAFIFLSLHLLLTVYLSISWGIELPFVILFFAVLIIMSGILIDSKMATIVTSLVGIIILINGNLQIKEVINPNLYWKKDMITVGDLIVFIVTLFIMNLVSWLSNKETERSLSRARRSEAALKRERDFLEVRVAERTKELKESQLQRVTELYRFAEFGRLSSGMFHDLMSPLTAVSLNLEKMSTDNSEKITKVKTNLNQALIATKKMQSFLTAIRKQIKGISTNRPNKLTRFSAADEIDDIIEILRHKAYESNVDIEFSPAKNVYLVGDIVKFGQIVINLVSNAIDSYDKVEKKQKKVLVTIEEKEALVVLKVQDWGMGISKELLPKIFDPFFSTKEKDDKGMGIGLPSTKKMIEEDFGGKINVASQISKGTTFVVYFKKHE